eukprot:CAMPEP_0176376822 /NCGR_PEP_ID=MMETSP0126-20121128/28455_1 /TAXON_ID=141414 ORGANISM="Strombidinopsis acuminatum, Strain SPMC142" /NCGR_SAMPLE_ID=MMETSP0126 /ASSEMBLY_ACC=CAM_ASM_000229 /LENGTH=108 /DNA_ID=CAMNT_0017738409 /DNA_START=1440 /DNA_END=1766 /DNA_ORIENTATION=+
MYRELDTKTVDFEMNLTRKDTRKTHQDGVKLEEDEKKRLAAQLKQKKKDEKVVTKGIKPVFKRSVKPEAKKKKEIKKIMSDEEKNRRRFLGDDFEDAFINDESEKVDG